MVPDMGSNLCRFKELIKEIIERPPPTGFSLNIYSLKTLRDLRVLCGEKPVSIAIPIPISIIPPV